MKLLIRQGRIIDPANGIDAVGDVYIADGKIVSVGVAAQGFVAEHVLNATNKLVLPGLVDLAVRLTAPEREAVEHSAAGQINAEIRAAIAGGVTSVAVPPEAHPVLDTPERAQAFRARIDAQSAAQDQQGLKIYPLGAMTAGLAGQRLTEMVGLTEAGCVAFSQGGTPIQDTAVLLRAMQYAASFGYALWVRPQDPWLSRAGVVARGAYATRLGLEGIAVEAETIALQTLLSLQRATGVRLHVCRLSSAQGVALVRAAKKEGLALTCDVAANNVHLTDIDIGFYDTNLRLDPPVRGQRDRDALRQGLLDGTIDAVCSDHTPLPKEGKLRPFARAASGSIGVELLLSLILKWAQEARVPLSEALKLVTGAPGAILGVPVGTLSVGASADLCIVDPQDYWIVSRESLLSQGTHTPFLGRELPGRVQTTVLRGEIVWERSV